MKSISLLILSLLSLQAVHAAKFMYSAIFPEAASVLAVETPKQPSYHFADAVRFIRTSSSLEEALPNEFIQRIQRILWFKSRTALENVSFDSSFTFPEIQFTIIHMAVEVQHIGVLESVLQALKANFTQEFIEALLNLRNECGDTALLIAIRKKNARSVELLLLAGADPNPPQVFWLSESDGPFRLLSGKSPLHLALRSQSHEISHHLLVHPKTNLSYQHQSKGRNVWHYAAKYCRDPEILKKLMTITTTTASTELLLGSDHSGYTPLCLAAGSTSTALQLILESGLFENKQKARNMLVNAYAHAFRNNRPANVEVLRQVLADMGLEITVAPRSSPDVDLPSCTIC